MLSKINKMNKKIFKMSNQKGQVAILLIFIIAVALIFYAISMNVGSMTQKKTLVTTASNSGAATLASQMASYGQQLFVEELGGRIEICSGGWLKILLLFVIAIASIFICGGGCVGWALALTVATVTLSVATIIIDATVVQPGITAMWNKTMTVTLSQRDRFLETGISTALQQAVTDPGKVLDFYDDDQDGVFHLEGAEKTDSIGRFAHYYGKRVATIPKPNNEKIKSFIAKLRCLTFGEDCPNDACLESSGICDDKCIAEGLCKAEDWRLTDPIHRLDMCKFDVATPTDFMPSVCNPCCLPETVPNPIQDDSDPLDNRVNIRPECCDTGDDTECGISTECSTHSPYRWDYPYVYDQAFEDPMNTTVSLREEIGVDDENKQFLRKEASRTAPIDEVVLNQNDDPSNKFSVWDATGLFDTDKERGMYSLFHKINNWKLDLSEVKTELSKPVIKGEACYWVDNEQAEIALKCNSDWDLEYPFMVGFPLYNDLILPINPYHVATAELAGNLIVYGPRIDVKPYVDNDKTGSSANFQPSVAHIDLVTALAADGSAIIIANPSDCAQEADNGNIPQKGFWKPGTDRYCSTPTISDDYPYNEECTKHKIGNCTVRDKNGNPMSVDCVCSELEERDPFRFDFNEDVIDDVVYGLRDFVVFVEALLKNSDEALFIGLADWYDTAAQWFEPIPNAAKDNCFNCDNQDHTGALIDGMFHMVHKKIKFLQTRFEQWEQTSYTKNNTAWCVPNATPTNTGHFINGDPYDVTVKGILESDTYDVNVNGVVGDMEDVKACLDWNASNKSGATFSGEGELFTGMENGSLPLNMVDGTIEGNASKFEHCALTCSAAACSNLPRSLVEGYNPAGLMTTAVSGHEGRLRGLLKCFYDSAPEPVPLAFSCQSVTLDLSSPEPSPVILVDAFDRPIIDRATNNPIILPPGQTFVLDPVTGNLVPAPQPPVILVDAFNRPIIDRATNNPIILPPGQTFVLDQITGNPIPTLPVIRLDSLGRVALTPAGNLVLVDAFGNSIIDAARNPIILTPQGPPPQYISPSPTNIDQVLAEIEAINGGCVPHHEQDVSLGGQQNWIDKTRQSAFEAAIQVGKFKHRSEFLTNILDQLSDIKVFLGTAEVKLDAFLNLEDRHPGEKVNGAFADLLQARKDLDDENKVPLPYQVIYAWQDKPKFDQAKEEASWHVVRVDGRIPGRCDKACSQSQKIKSKAHPWPKVHSYTKGLFGSTRCYELINTTGVVKMRVTRYDSPKNNESGARNILKFPNGVPIWDFRKTHPERSKLRGGNNEDAIVQGLSDYSLFPGGFCKDAVTGKGGSTLIGTFEDSDLFKNAYEGGFILNEQMIKEYDEKGNITGYDVTLKKCWNDMVQLLSLGVVSETCAQYYYHGGAHKGMSFQFVECKDHCPGDQVCSF